MTPESQRLLRWTARMVDARKQLSLTESEALNGWIESGNKRSEWIGWTALIGEKPRELSTSRKQSEAVAISTPRERRA